MKKLLLAALMLAGTAQAQQWTDSVTVGTRVNASLVTATKVKVWLPSGATPKALLIATNAYRSKLKTSRHFLYNPAIWQSAAANQLALVAIEPTLADTGIAIGFDPTLGHADSLNKAMAILAQRANNPAINNAPFILFGHGKGAGFAQQLAMYSPSRTAALISYHALNINNPAWVNTPPYSPTANSLKTVPHLVMSGELEGPDMNNNKRPYLADTMRRFVLQRRAAGELVHQAIEMNGNHYHMNPRGAAYVASFIATTVAKRLAAGAVVALTENSGALGKVTTNYVFERTNYPTTGFNAATAAASHWFYDQPSALAWANFHQSAFRIGLTPPPLPVAPYVSGRNVSGMVITYDLADPMTQAVFGDSNVVRVEMSNAWGDFTNARYPMLIAGSSLRRDTTGYTSSSGSAGYIEVPLPDNLQYDLTTTRPRYRVRLTTSHPVMESSNAGEIGDLVIGTPYDMYLDALPAGTLLARGKDVKLTVNRTATFNTTAGNRFIVQLSDSAGSFDNALTIGDTAAQFTANTITLRGNIPTNVIDGYRYRVRVKSTAPLDSSSNNGSDLQLGNIITALDSKSFTTTSPVLAVYPNPTQTTATLQLDVAAVGTGDYSLVNAAGQVVATSTFEKTSPYAISIPVSVSQPGLYVVKLRLGSQQWHTRLVKN